MKHSEVKRPVTRLPMVTDPRAQTAELRTMATQTMKTRAETFMRDGKDVNSPDVPSVPAPMLDALASLLKTEEAHKLFVIIYRRIRDRLPRVVRWVLDTALPGV